MEDKFVLANIAKIIQRTNARRNEESQGIAKNPRFTSSRQKSGRTRSQHWAWTLEEEIENNLKTSYRLIEPN